MAWNWRELHAALMASPAFAVFLCGHDHMGGYRQDGDKHFVTVEAMLEGVGSSIQLNICDRSLIIHLDHKFGKAHLFPDCKGGFEISQPVEISNFPKG